MQTTRDKVEAGSLLLDHHRPGWAEQIDIEALNLSSCDQCVLGQLFVSFTDGLRELDVIGLSSQCGFALAQASETGFENRKRWKELRELWLEQIEARLLSAELREAEMALA